MSAEERASKPNNIPISLPLWLQNSLPRRLMLGLVVALLVSSALLVVLALALGQENVRQQHEEAAQRVARLFEASLQNAMLKRDLIGMTGILTSLGSLSGITQARLLAPNGLVRFASRSDLVGMDAQAQLEGLCLETGCKAPAPRLQWLQQPRGEQLQIAYPIHNQPPCAQCHGLASAHPVNGVLLVDFEPLAKLDPLSRQGLLLLAAGLATLALFAVFMGLTLRSQVSSPLKRLVKTTDRLAAGELEARLGKEAHGLDELGRLAQSFDQMAERLETTVNDLAGQHEFLQRLVDAIPDPVLVIGQDFRIRLANSAYVELLGLSSQPLVGQCCHRLSRGQKEPCSSTLLHCPVVETGTQQERLRTMMGLQKADGSAVEVDIEAAPLVTQSGETLVVEVMRPLDRLVRFSQEQRLSTIGLLANGVAHEIHNPLASIRLALQASLRGLRKGNMEQDELIDYLELVDREIDRCVVTTQRLLQMSQAPRESLEPVALGTALGDVLSLLGEECQRNGVTMEVEVTPADVRVMADEAELRQVLVNLIHNALHAMPGGGHIKIIGKVDEAPSETLETDYLLEVQDTGSGIPAEEQSLIFQPFFSRRADGQRGTGLGLAICKAAVERFGGHISLKSAPEEGSVFRLRLRLAVDANGEPDR